MTTRRRTGWWLLVGLLGLVAVVVPGTTAAASADEGPTVPTITVTPLAEPIPDAALSRSTGIADGESVLVTGANWNPDDPPSIAQCATGPFALFPCVSAEAPSVSPDGDFAFALTLYRLIPTDQGIYDCAQPGVCSVLVGVSLSEFVDHLSLPVQLIDDGPIPTPTLTVTPSTALVDGQVVSVLAGNLSSITGPPHRIELHLAQCRAGASSFADCDGSDSGSVPPPEPDGTFAAAFTVKRVLDLESGPFDCASAPGACEMTYVMGWWLINPAAAGLTFVADAVDPAVPAPVEVGPAFTG